MHVAVCDFMRANARILECLFCYNYTLVQPLMAHEERLNSDALPEGGVKVANVTRAFKCPSAAHRLGISQDQR